METAILTRNLTKYYRKKPGCLDVSLEIPVGSAVGLLGPNGAGKSTVVKLLTGLLKPTSGSAEVMGHPAGTVGAKRRLGYLPELFRYQEWMTGRDLLHFHGELCGLPKPMIEGRAREMLELTGLSGQERFRVGTYSKGMQQRIGLACALMGDPDVIFLDEPTSALDPIGRIEVRRIVMTLKGMGKTILLNSHLLTEVEQVCDRIAFIRRGSIVRSGTLDELMKPDGQLKLKVGGLTASVEARLREIDPGLTQADGHLVLTAGTDEVAADVAAIIVGGGGRLYGMERTERDLEAFFVQTATGGQEGGAG